MIRKFTIVPALFGIIALIISACSSSGGGGSDGGQGTSVPSEMVGTWALSDITKWEITDCDPGSSPSSVCSTGAGSIELTEEQYLVIEKSGSVRFGGKAMKATYSKGGEYPVMLMEDVSGNPDSYFQVEYYKWDSGGETKESLEMYEYYKNNGGDVMYSDQGQEYYKFWSFERSTDSTASVGNTAEKSIISIADLQGTWSTGCYDDDGFFYRETLVFSGTNLTSEFVPYSDKLCKNAEMKLSYTGNNVSVGGMVNLDDNSAGYQLSMKLQKVEYTPLSQDDASYMNAVASCGLTNWQKNVTVDLIGKDCGGQTISKNDQLLNVFRFVDGYLNVGGGSLTAYPTSVPDVPFIRQ